jgi:hypothetical protein
MSSELAMPVAALTQLAFGFNSLLDADAHVDPAEVQRRIYDETLFEWLETLYPEMIRMRAGLLRENPLDRLAVMELFKGLAPTSKTGRIYAVERNGLALLLAYCIEGIQRLHPFGPDSLPRREQ